jgi:ribosomal protein S18 acetylase RimI-like enzyme
MIEVLVADYNNPNHARDIVQLLDHYSRDTMGGGKPLKAETREHLIPELKKRDFAFSILCYIDGQPAGLTNCMEAFSTFACQPLLNIHDLVVHSQFRGQQVSQKMLEKVELAAREKSCCKITLEVLEGNHIAQFAYKKFGFTGYELDESAGQALFWEKTL